MTFCKEEARLSEIMEKLAETKYDIHELLKGRWSPRAFSTRSVEPEKLLSLFEAARWSPSAGNTQPWSYVVTTIDQPEHAELVEALAGFNKVWAKNAPVLLLAVAKPNPERPGSESYAFYDLGQSVAHMSIQAEAVGLQVHQMGGFDHAKVSELFDIPELFKPLTVIAIGYSGRVEDLPEPLRERELQVRTRKPLSEFVYGGRWDWPIEPTARELILAGSPDGK
jgi:nitroreductase